jgi:hypothetical protein
MKSLDTNVLSESPAADTIDDEPDAIAAQYSDFTTITEPELLYAMALLSRGKRRGSCNPEIFALDPAGTTPATRGDADIATRNTADDAGCALEVINPWL